MLFVVYPEAQYNELMNKYKRMCVIAGRLKKENDRLKERPANLYKEQRLARMEERNSQKKSKLTEDNTSD